MPSVPFLLFFAFLGLKLAGVVSWSWWWVTSPLWISAALGAVFFVISAVFGFAFLACAKKFLDR